MSKAEILDELPRLKSEELAEIQSRIEELAVYGPDGWLADGELTDAEPLFTFAELLLRHGAMELQAFLDGQRALGFDGGQKFLAFGEIDRPGSHGT